MLPDNEFSFQFTRASSGLSTCQSELGFHVLFHNDSSLGFFRFRFVFCVGATEFFVKPRKLSVRRNKLLICALFCHAPIM